MATILLASGILSPFSQRRIASVVTPSFWANWLLLIPAARRHVNSLFMSSVYTVLVLRSTPFWC